MKKNMGKVDTIVRLVLAVVMAVLFFTNTVSGVFGMVVVILGGVFAATSVISFCPLYVPFGINTCKKK